MGGAERGGSASDGKQTRSRPWIAFSPDSKSLAFNQSDTLRLLNIATGKVSASLGHAAFAADFTADGRNLILVQPSDDLKNLAIVRWDVPGGKPVKQWTVDLDPTRQDDLRPFVSSFEFSFSRDRHMLAIVNKRTRQEKDWIRVFDTTTGVESRRWPVRPAIGNLAFSPNGQLFAAFDMNPAVGIQSAAWVWEVATNKEKLRWNVETGAIAGFPAFVFAPDGASVFCTDKKGITRWDWKTGQRLQDYRDVGGPIVFLPDGKTMAVQGYSGSVRLLATATGKDIRPLPHADLSVALSTDFRRVAWCEGREIVLAETAGGAELRIPHEHGRFAGPLAFAPDGKLLASTGYDSRVRLREVPAGQKIRDIPASADRGLYFAADGRRLVTYGTNQVHTVDIVSGQRTFWKLAGGYDGRAAVAPDLSAAVAGNRQARLMRLVDPASGTVKRTLQGYCVDVEYQRSLKMDGYQSTAFSPMMSPNGRLVLAGGAAPGQTWARALWFWDVASGKRLPQLLSGETMMLEHIAFSPDSRLLAAMRADGAVCLLSTITGYTVRVLGKGYDRLSTAPVFAPDGRTLVTAGKGHLQFWETATGGEIACRDAHQSNIRKLVMAATGSRLASVSSDHTTLIWDLNRLATDDGARDATIAATALPALWTDLASPAAVKGRRAAETLIAAPEQAVRLLRAHLKSTPTPDAEKVAAWIAALGSDEFERRQNAEQELDRLADSIAPMLQASLAANPPLEGRRRVEALLTRLDSVHLSAEALRGVRAVQVLESIGSQEARGVLQSLASGAAASRQTQDAKASLARLVKWAGP
jgi:WD40 repeat protein